MKKIILLSAIAMAAIGLSSCGNSGSANTSEQAVQANGATDFLTNIKVSDKPTHGKENPAVLILASSPRKNGNTQQLAAEFARGAEEVGAQVETILLAEKKINFLNEEQADAHEGVGEQDDDAPEIIKKMLAADILVLASPVYYMNIDAIMKALIDRTFTNGAFQQMKNKEFYYITACADAEDATAMCAINGFRGFAYCLPGSVERGMVKAIGVGGVKSASKTEFGKQAYELGKTVK